MPMTVATFPLNIWTRGEFDRWIRETVKEELGPLRNGGRSDDEVAALMLHVVREINYHIVPAGNA